MSKIFWFTFIQKNYGANLTTQNVLLKLYHSMAVGLRMKPTNRVFMSRKGPVAGKGMLDFVEDLR